MRFLIEFGKELVVGEFIQTRGNDDEFPTFILDDGRRVGVAIDNVIGLEAE